MRRIKVSEGGVADPVSGKITFPSAPAAGILDPSLMNHIQEEIAGVIEAAGLTLNENNRYQMIEAIRKLNRVMTSRTINVPGDYATIQDALDSLKGVAVDPNVEIVIQLTNNTHPTVTSTIAIDQHHGHKITLRGDVGTPANRTLNFNMSTGDACIRVGFNSAIKIEGINLANTGNAGFNRAYIRAERGGFIQATQLRTTGMLQFGAFADSGGMIRIDGGRIEGPYGAVAQYGGYIAIYGSQLVGQGGTLEWDQYEDANPTQIGVWARYHGSIYCEYSSITSYKLTALADYNGFLWLEEGNFSMPVNAKHSGSVRARNVNITFNTENAGTVDVAAWHSHTGGLIDCNNCDSLGTSVYGFKVSSNGRMNLYGTNATNFHPYWAEAGGHMYASYTTCQNAGVGYYATKGGSIFGSYMTAYCSAGGTSYQATLGSRIIAQLFNYGGGAYGFQCSYGSQIISAQARVLPNGITPPTTATINNNAGYVYPP